MRYANACGGTVKKLLNEAGLTDIARHLYNPDDVEPKHPGYTRYGRTVFTRLDRLHADIHRWPWLSAGTATSGFDHQISDHLPTKAVIATPKLGNAGKAHGARSLETVLARGDHRTD